MGRREYKKHKKLKIELCWRAGPNLSRFALQGYELIDSLTDHRIVNFNPIKIKQIDPIIWSHLTSLCILNNIINKYMSRIKHDGNKVKH